MPTWHTINWTTLGIELLRIILAALSGATGGYVVS